MKFYIGLQGRYVCFPPNRKMRRKKEILHGGLEFKQKLPESPYLVDFSKTSFPKSSVKK